MNQVVIFKPRYVTEAELTDLYSLYHLAKVPLSGASPNTHSKCVWAAREFHRRVPEVPALSGYKDLIDSIRFQNGL